jgi:hypothetical protein
VNSTSQAASTPTPARDTSWPPTIFQPSSASRLDGSDGAMSCSTVGSTLVGIHSPPAAARNR